MSLFAVSGLSVDMMRDGLTSRIVDHVGFDLDEGSIVDLAGVSGCGKSTLLRACALMLPHSEGALALRGRPHTDFEPARWRACVCLIPQKASLVPGSVRDNLLLPWKLAVRKNSPMPSDADLRHSMDEALLDDVPLNREANRLSGGQAARVALLRAFLTGPDVLLMDEVDAALDSESSAAVSRITQAAANRGTACLRIRHRGPDGLASRTLHMADGRLSESAATAGKPGSAGSAVSQGQQEAHRG